MWKGLEEFFTYSRKQRNGIYALLALIAALWLLLLVDDYLYTPEKGSLSRYREYVRKWKEQDSLHRFARYNFTPFPFDPNIADDSVFRALHLGEGQIRTILRYRAKGGKFYTLSHFEGIYGLDSLWLRKVKPFIRITDTEEKQKEPYKPVYSFHPFDPNTVELDELRKMGLRSWQAQKIITYREKVMPYSRRDQLYEVYGLDSALVEKMLAYVTIDTSAIPGRKVNIPEEIVVELNKADSTSLLEIRGIGPTFASRIISYRERLGGFYKKEQLLEVYGINKEIYHAMEDHIEVDPGEIRKISLNSASFKDLLSHPYLEYEVVKNIISFRDRRRPYKKLEELRNIELVDEVLFSKIAKYLKL